MYELVAALAGLPFLFEDAILGAGRAEVLVFVQQGGLNGGWGTVLESLFMQDGQHTGSFVRTERPSGSRPLRQQSRLGDRRGRWAQDRPLPIEGSTGHSQEIAGGHDAHRGGQMGDSVHQDFSLGSAFGSGPPTAHPLFFEHP